MIEREKEFDCVECGQHVVAVVWETSRPLLCAMCVHVPGWFNEPKLQQLYDPEGELAARRAARAPTAAIDAEVDRVLDRARGRGQAKDR